MNIELAPLPGHSPDLVLVEALWRWLRKDITYHHCYAMTGDLTRQRAAFKAQVNQDPCAAADRLWARDHPSLDKEKLRFSSQMQFSSQDASDEMYLRENTGIRSVGAGPVRRP